MKEDKKVKEYFEKTAKDFDDIYDNRGGPIKKIANKLFRKGMRERFNLTLQLCSSENKTLLDIGCGAGRFTIPLAEKGTRVTGIDYSQEMIRMARDYLKNYEKKTNKKLDIKYFCSDFLKDFPSDKSFDLVLAIGVFDYLQEPLPFLKKMKAVTDETIITSFPKKFTPQMPIRKLWLMTKKCPAYFYTKEEIKKLYSSAGVKDYEIIDISAGYLVKAHV